MEPYLPPAKTEGGVFIPETAQERERYIALACKVLAMGPDAYGDMEKFSSGPWCKVGDWVMIGRYAGSRFKVDDVEYRFLNDDEIIGVVADPAFVKRIRPG